jgi:hypothetical protein
MNVTVPVGATPPPAVLTTAVMVSGVPALMVDKGELTDTAVFPFTTVKATVDG